MCTVALLAAAVCVLAPWSLPIGSVSITLATFAVYLVAAVGGYRAGVAAIAVYIALGAVGMPVFSGFSGGAHHIIGPTGGYLIGYIPCALITGAFVDRSPETCWNYFVGMALGTLSCYAIGTVWFMNSADYTLDSALAVCVLPFIPFDTVKIVAAGFVGRAIRLRLHKNA